MTHLLVVGLDVTAPTRDDDLRALASTWGGPADVAYLQLGDPSLVAALARLSDDGVTAVDLVGVVVGADGPAPSCLRRVAAHQVRARPDGPEVRVSSTVLRDLTPDALATAASGWRRVHGTEAPLTSAAWEDVPAHRHQVLVCRGPRCSARGADATAAALGESLRARGLGDDDVLVTQTGCQFPCNHAPVVTVQPGDVWYGGLLASDADVLVDEHLAGVPLEERRLRR